MPLERLQELRRRVLQAKLAYFHQGPGCLCPWELWRARRDPLCPGHLVLWRSWRKAIDLVQATERLWDRARGPPAI